MNLSWWPLAAVEPTLRQLALAALQGSLFILAVWVLCRLVPRLPPSPRCALWWAAGLKLLLGLLWLAPLAAVAPSLALPVLPPGLFSRPATGAAALTSSRGSSDLPGRSATGRQPSHCCMGAAGGPDSGPSVNSLAPLSRRGLRGPLARWGLGPGREGRPLDRRPGSALPAAAGATGVAPWQLALAGAWLAGLLAAAARTGGSLICTRALLARARPVAEGSGSRVLLAELAARAGVRRRVELRISEEIGTPQTLGILRPVILLPAGASAVLSRGELAMALCHELVHVRRRDLLWCWVPALAERLFFFLPLAALSGREYGLAREAACDAEVLRLLSLSPAAYGRLLLRLASSPRGVDRARLLAASPAALGTLSSTPSARTLKRRLQMLQTPSAATRSSWSRLAGAGVLLLAGIAPFRLVAAGTASDASPAPSHPAPILAASRVQAGQAAPAQAAASPARQGETAPALAAASQAQAGAAAPAVVAGASAPGDSGSAALAGTGGEEQPVPGEAAQDSTLAGAGYTVAGTAAVEKVGAAAPAYAVAGGRVGGAIGGRVGGAPGAQAGASSGYGYATGEAGEDSYLLWSGEGEGAMSFSGSARGLGSEQLKALRERVKGEFLWFSHGNKSYWTRDPGVLEQARQALAPQQELGRRQGELGTQQGKLGAQQGALGAQQAKLGARIAELAAGKVRHAAEVLAQAANQKEAGAESGPKAENEHSDEIEKVSSQMAKLGKQQQELGEQQAKLGRLQGELGRRQGELSRKVAHQMQELITGVLSRHLAEELP